MIRIFPTCTAAFILMFALLITPNPVQACKGGARHHGSQKVSQPSPEEQNIITELNTKYRPLIHKQQQQLAVKQAELQAVMTQEVFDADKAKSLSLEMNSLHNKLMEMKMSKKIELREKGIAYPAPCTVQNSGTRPCAVVADQKGPGCKGGKNKQCVRNRPCTL